MTIAVLQELQTAAAGNGGTIAQATTTVAGSSLDVYVTWDNGAGSITLSSVSDGSSVFTLRDTIVDTVNTQSIAHYTADSVAAGARTVTATFSAVTDFRGIWVKEIGATAGYDSPNGHAGQNQQTPTTAANAVSSGATGTLSAATSLLSALSLDVLGNVGPTAGTGFTAGATGWNFGGSNAATSESFQVTGTAAQTATFTAAANDSHLTLVAIFKAVPAAPTGSGAATEGHDTVAGSGTTAGSGTAAITEGHDTAAASGSVTTGGTAAVTEAHDIAAGVGNPPLAQWFSVRAAVAAGSRRARLVCVGDSLTAGCNSTANEMGSNARSGGFPLAMASAFHAAPAHADAWLADSNAANNGATLAQYDSRITLGSGWQSDTGDTPTAGGYYAEQGSATSSSLAFTPAGTLDTLTVWYAKYSGSPQYTVNVDGGSSLGTLAANAAAAIGTATFSVSAGTHTINVVSNGTAAGKIFGVESWNSASPAIQVIAAGANGWTAGDWVQNNSQPWDPQPFLTFLAPDLTLICLGKNEQDQNISQTTFQTNLTSVVQTCLSAGSPVVILSPPLANPANLASGMSEAAQLAYETNMASVASSLGCSFLSLTGRPNWGSYSAANSAGFMSTDGVHCTSAGYADIAKALLGVIDAGTAAVTEAHDTASASGAVSTGGTAAITQPADTASGSGSVTTSGSGSATEGADTASASGSITTSGSGSATESADVAAGSGTQGSGATGSAAITEPADTATATGSVTTSGSGSAAEAHDIAAGTGAAGFVGSGAATEGADTAAGSGSVTTSGSGAASEGGDVASGSGLAGNTITGSGAATESPDSMSGTGGPPVTTVLGGPRYIIKRIRLRLFNIARSRGRQFTVSAVSARFDVKGPAEQVPLTFDCTIDLLPGETLIGTPTLLGIVTSLGTDPDPALIQNGLPALDPTSMKVILPVKGGLDLCEYDVTILCATSNPLKTLTLIGTLPVRIKNT